MELTRPPQNSPSEIGFGVLKSKDFIEILSQSGDPTIDFKNARKSQNITISIMGTPEH
jgi:hypothetical protein